MRSALTVTVQVVATVVTLVSSTIGSWVLGVVVMTDCANTASSCASANALLVGGWVVQGALLLSALALWTPAARRRLDRGRIMGLALVVLVLAVLCFGGVAWGASNSYCTGRDGGDYCDVQLRPETRPDS